ncbi:EamA family transporter [Jiangella asiatica]|uniref:EamA family transporter n=1 Tax=Jiangella asiatica TaxID=2530372 RepID=A0A4R5CCC5_9ACTN|nr:EamA family transporter [Jiangella asiatica]TDD94804.1 EamA family transporter [Jiangella asiatica]
MSRQSPARGVAFVCLAAVFFSVNASMSKVALEGGLEPSVLAALRATGAAVVLLGAVLAVEPARLRIGRREWPFLIALGVAGGALVQWLYFVAIDRLPVGIALLLEFTAPAMVALFSWVVLRQRIRPRTWLGIGIALFGLALVAQVWTDAGLDAVGVLAALGAAACLASYYLIGSRMSGDRDSLSLTFWMFGFAAVFWAVAQPWWTVDLAPLGRETSMLGAMDGVSIPVWASVLWIIVFGTIVAYGLNLAALRHISPTTCGVIGMSEPVGAALVAWVWLGQTLGVAQMIGGLAVLTGIAIAETGRQVVTAGVTSPVEAGTEAAPVGPLTPEAEAAPH